MCGACRSVGLPKNCALTQGNVMARSRYLHRGRGTGWGDAGVPVGRGRGAGGRGRPGRAAADGASGFRWACVCGGGRVAAAAGGGGAVGEVAAADVPDRRHPRVGRQGGSAGVAAAPAFRPPRGGGGEVRLDGRGAQPAGGAERASGCAADAARACAGRDRVGRAREGGDGRATVRLADGPTIGCRLVVAAEGRRSPLREQAGIRVTTMPYSQSGIVAAIAHERPHRNVALEHFLPAGPFAQLPMVGTEGAPHVSAIVWTERTPMAERLYRADDAVFGREIARRLGPHLGARAADRAAVALSALGDACAALCRRAAGAGRRRGARHPSDRRAGAQSRLPRRDRAVGAAARRRCARAAILGRRRCWRRISASGGGPTC